ncbi:MAG: type I-C CRISPR-associated endonuclease Cas1c [Verrucomicrobiota bacterium]|nr:type I-C CRISPR-associated endonuclease Cas1c [Verrucomicrobiota bacterium]
MKTHLNSLYVTLEGSWLTKDGQAVDIRHEKQSKLRVPLHNLESIVCLGYDIGMSPQLMGACAEAGITVSFLSPNGKFMASVHGPTKGNVLLRRQQYRKADDEEACLLIAKENIAAKIANGRTVLLRAIRDHGADDLLEQKSLALARSVDEARRTNSLDALRGIEGDAASSYFQAFPRLIRSDEPSFVFKDRNRRPPLDPVNALLSYLYTILAHDARSACESVGLDSSVGFLHRDRPGRPSLALDLMEEFRPVLADRLVLSLINRQQIKRTDFKTRESGAVEMSDETRKAILAAYQERKRDEVHHPFLNEKVTVGLLLLLQARLLARHIRGDLDAYPPYIWK